MLKTNRLSCIRQKLVLSIILIGFLGAVAYEQRELLEPETPIEDFLQTESGQGSQGDAPNPNDKPYPVAVALLHSDYTPDEDLLYFRQQVLSKFDGKRLPFGVGVFYYPNKTKYKH